MRRRDFLKRTACLGTGVLATNAMSRARAETAQGAARKPNIVFLLADQWRASATGYAGDPNVLTPNLDRLARESISFTNTISVCPVCTPYRASLMTGRYPTTTGMFLNDLHLPTDELCMPEIFQLAGYDTAYIGKWHLDGHGRDAFIPPGRRQGWAYWKAAECEHNNYRSHYYAGNSDEKQFWEGYDAFAQTADAQQYIRNRAGDAPPFILMLSYGPPHPASQLAPEAYRELYTEEELILPPNVPEEDSKEARVHLHRYYAHCTALDHCVGELLETLQASGIAENTILVFTSDHGGMLLSQGDPQHWKQQSWDESVRVPFLLRYPAAHGNEGREIETPWNTPDILPTLLGLAGIQIPGTIEGEDLSRLIQDGGEMPGRATLYMNVTPFAGHTDYIPYRAARTRQHTYVRNLDGPWRLFDDIRDPYQMQNLIKEPEYAQLVEQLDAELQKQLERVGDDFRPAQAYIDEWGYHVDDAGAIPYRPPVVPQGPSLDSVHHRIHPEASVDPET